MKGKDPKTFEGGLDVDGWGWMLHGDMGEDNKGAGHVADPKWAADHKKTWIQSGPHLMLFPKDASRWKDASTDFNSGAPYMMFQDTPFAHVMIPVNDDYYRYQAQVAETSKEFAVFGHVILRDGQPTATLMLPVLFAASLVMGLAVSIRRARASTFKAVPNGAESPSGSEEMA